MKISRDPNSPDFAFDFDNFQILQNGMPTLNSSVCFADDEAGEIGYFEWASDTDIAVDDQGEPVVNIWSAAITLVNDQPRKQCSPCRLKAIRRGYWWIQ